MRAILVGLGPIGVEVGRTLRARGVTVAGGADPAHAGTVLALAEGEELQVAATAAEAYGAAAADVAVLCTGSRLPRVAEQIEEAIAAGLHVVSTCEELSYPWLKHRALAERLDGLARARGVAVLGTGVNPGLVMDRLPWLVAQGCASIEHVCVSRHVDAARRRAPLRAKVGAGMSIADLEAGLATGGMGHAGLAESAALLASGLGWPVTTVEETARAVVDSTGALALGVRQTARVLVDGVERVRLELEMYVGAEGGDRIVVKGDPPLDVRVIGGFHGDRATVGAVANAVDRIGRMGPGLVNVTYR